MQIPTSGRPTVRRWAHVVAGGAAALIVGTALAAPAGAATPTARPIGASGTVAALTPSSSSMEVQSTSSQTTVSWTGTTRFTKTVTETVSSLAVGDCVSVTGTQSKKSKTTIAARSITVTTAPSSTGSCITFGNRAGAGGPAGGSGAGGFRPPGGGGGFQRGAGGSGTRPSVSGGGGGAAGGSSNFRKQLASLSIANGKVTSVKGTKVIISGTKLALGSFAGRGAATTKSKSSTAKGQTKIPTPKTQKLTITTASSTTLTSTQSVSSTDLTVGDCVSAFGQAASNGAVTATTVSISSPVGGSCTTTGFRGGFFGGGGFPGGRPGGAGGGGG
jgi:hypothetical protein